MAREKKIRARAKRTRKFTCICKNTFRGWPNMSEGYKKGTDNNEECNTLEGKGYAFRIAGEENGKNNDKENKSVYENKIGVYDRHIIKKDVGHWTACPL